MWFLYLTRHHINTLRAGRQALTAPSFLSKALVLNSYALLIFYHWLYEMACFIMYLKFPFPALKQILTAVKDGWAAKASSWRNICTKWSTIFLAAHAPTPEKLHTALLKSMIELRGRTFAGKMQVVQRKNWRSISQLHDTASAPCSLWKAQRLQHSTAAIMIICSWLPEGKEQVHQTWSALNSQQNSITKWTFCLGLYAKVTGADTMKHGLQTMGRSVQKTLQTKTTTSSFKKQGNTEIFLLFRHKTAFVSWIAKNW